MPPGAGEIAPARSDQSESINRKKIDELPISLNQTFALVGGPGCANGFWRPGSL